MTVQCMHIIFLIVYQLFLLNYLLNLLNANLRVCFYYYCVFPLGVITEDQMTKNLTTLNIFIIQVDFGNASFWMVLILPNFLHCSLGLIQACQNARPLLSLIFHILFSSSVRFLYFSSFSLMK